MASPEQPPLPLLFLIGDTGGGHRSAAAAVAQALEHLLPGRFVPVICDPLRGPDVPRPLRWFSGLYGPCIRLTPWLWWLFWRASDSPRVLGAVRRAGLALSNLVEECDNVLRQWPAACISLLMLAALFGASMLLSF